MECEREMAREMGVDVDGGGKNESEKAVTQGGEDVIEVALSPAEGSSARNTRSRSKSPLPESGGAATPSKRGPGRPKKKA
jgi:hypothetical protein